MADESIGKITLDLEVQSDIQKQVSGISNTIGNKIKSSLEGSTKKAFSGVKKNISNSTQGISKSIDATFKRMKDSMKKGVESAYSSFKNAKMPKINFPKPSAVDASAQAMPTMASPRGPPMAKVNTGINVEQVKAQINNITASLDNTNAKIDQQKSKLVELKKSYEYAFNPGIKSKLHEDILKTESNIIKLISASDKAGFKLADLDAQFEKLSNSTRETASGIGAANEKIKQTVKSASSVSGATKKLNLFGKSGKDAGNSFRNAQGSMSGFFGSFIKYGLLFMLMQKAVMGLGSALGSSLMVNSQFANSLAQIKTNLLVAFMPIYNAVLPALNALMSALATVTAYIASFVNALFGSTYKAGFGAAKNLQASISAMNDMNKASSGAGKAIKKAGKEAKGALAGFDQLNILQIPKDNDDPESDAGGGLVAPSMDMSPVEASMGALAEKFKEIMSKIFQSFKEAWAAEGVNTINSMKYALSSIWELIKAIGSSFLEVWTNGTGTIFLTNILKIVQNIFNLVGNLATAFTEAWNTNNIGTQIIQHIFDLLNIILGTIEGITRATAEWAKKLDFTPLLNSIDGLLKALAPLTKNIGAGLEWFWNNVLLPIASWTIQKALPLFLDILSQAIKILNGVIEALKPLASWLWDTFLKPLASWTGGLIIDVLESIKNGLKGISDWISDHQATIETIAIIIGSFAAAWGLVNIAMGAWSVVGTIAAGVTWLMTYGTTALGVALLSVNWPLVLIVAAIAAVIAIGVLLYKNQDVIKQKILDVWTWIQEKFQAFKDWLGNVFATDWSKKFGFFGEILNNYLAKVRNIFDNVKTIFSGIITFVSGVFTGNWNKALSGLISIATGAFNLVKNVITSPITTAVNFVRDQVDKIKGFFSRLNIKIPNIPLPHFSLKGSFSLLPPSVPKLDVKWYAKGGVLEQPTTFAGVGAGEAGNEAFVPLEGRHMHPMAQYIADLLESKGGSNDNQNLIEKILQKLDRIIILLQKAAMGGDIVIPVYIGNDLIENIVIKAQDRINIKSNGRR